MEAFVLLIIFVVEGNVTDGDFSACDKHSQEQQIVSINRGEQFSGSFFLGTGHIDSTSYYYTYIKESLGYTLRSFRTNNTYIVETSGTPKITFDNFHCPKPISDFMIGGENFRQHQQWNRVIHVPHNTILREFKL